MSEIHVPRDPAEFGQHFAEEFFFSGVLDEFDGDQRGIDRRLVEIDRMADSLAFLGQAYFVESGRALSVPVSINPGNGAVSHWQFEGLTFRGDLETFSAVKIGRLIGGNAIRAFCLTFNNVTLLPGFDHLPDDHLLHVPAYAVRDMSRLAA
jgi:hypothetical protein